MIDSIAEILPRIKTLATKIDNKSVITGKSWGVINPTDNLNGYLIFDDNDELLILNNGEVQTVQWKFLNNGVLSLNIEGNRQLFDLVLYDSNLLILKPMMGSNCIALVEKSKFESGINSFNKVDNYIDSVESQKRKTQTILKEGKRSVFDFFKVLLIFFIIVVIALLVLMPLVGN